MKGECAANGRAHYCLAAWEAAPYGQPSVHFPGILLVVDIQTSMVRPFIIGINSTAIDCDWSASAFFFGFVRNGWAVGRVQETRPATLRPSRLVCHKNGPDSVQKRNFPSESTCLERTNASRRSCAHWIDAWAALAVWVPSWTDNDDQTTIIIIFIKLVEIVRRWLARFCSAWLDSRRPAFCLTPRLARKQWLSGLDLSSLLHFSRVQRINHSTENANDTVNKDDMHIFVFGPSPILHTDSRAVSQTATGCQKSNDSGFNTNFLVGWIEFGRAPACSEMLIGKLLGVFGWPFILHPPPSVPYKYLRLQRTLLRLSLVLQ
ncbi:hypothetical protein FRB91_005276 [Serendipita sp. 411]|nr:hypothetical protein FRB91_005276 [Serendipita sp. 411]